MTARRSGLHFFGWGFGICLSVLFASLWGRAVVIDTETLGESLAPMARSDLVVGFLTDWMAEEMVEGGVEASLVDPAVDYFINSSQVGGTLDRLAIEVVAAAASPDPAGSSIDMRGLVAPAIPEVTAGLNGMGIAVSEAQVTQVAEGLDPLEIREPGSDAMVGPNSGTATHLGTASLLAMVGLMIFGTGYLAVSDDRTIALRSLVTRIAVGGLSFGLLLRIGSWVLAPDGGRAPVRETLAAIAGSKWIVPFQLGLAAAVIAVSIYVAIRVVRDRTTAGTAQTPSRSRVR
ncbi:MAG TPA: hypothetical protein VG872_02425 [Acidimicrobiia bacterium]|nr:hypothetical protein [Acidimicrobiia bacterium]